MFILRRVLLALALVFGAACGSLEVPEVAEVANSAVDDSLNGVRAVPPTPSALPERSAAGAEAASAAPASPTVTTEAVSPVTPTGDPFLIPFSPALTLTGSGGTYETGRTPCDRAVSGPLWTGVTSFVWVCDDGRVISLDANVGHETWVADLPVEALHEWIGRTGETTTAVGAAIVDATMHTVPAVGLGAETYELIVTVIDGDTGTETGRWVHEASSDRYRFWWSPLNSRAVVGFVDLAGQRQLVVIDTDAGSEVLSRADLWVHHDDDQRIDGRFVPVELDGDAGAETMRFLDLVTGDIASGVTRLHKFFEHRDHECSPYVAAKTGLLDDSWHLIDPTLPGLSVPVPDRYFPELVAEVGLLIRDRDQWAMLTPDGITWTLDRAVARHPRYVNGELSFENQSGERIAVDTATGAEAGPAVHTHYRTPTTVPGGTVVSDGRTITFFETPPCGS